jgi:P27 family predicted phage terminase small subunit
LGRAGQGRPSKPTALKILDGDRRDRINRNEPRPAESAVKPTQELAPYAQAAWDRTTPDLITKGVLTSWDAELFTGYCVMVGAFRQASEQLRLHGLVVEGAAGGEVKSPYWQIARDSLDAMARLGARFGLSPADRAGLSIGGADSADGSGPERFLT